LVAVERGDLDAALSQYERILGKAALGRGPAEHWAHADYGWLLYQQGDLEQARFHLEKAINVCEEEGCSATDSQVGEHHYRLGEIYWSLGGKLKTDKQYAYTMVRGILYWYYSFDN
jgi:tetratricopeptide (TPR) repeat protein